MTLRLTLLADFFSAGFFPTGADSDRGFLHIVNYFSYYHYKNKLNSSFSGHPDRRQQWLARLGVMPGRGIIKNTVNLVYLLSFCLLSYFWFD